MPPSLSLPPRIVFFDLDDTLFDHRHCTRQALAGVRETYACFQQWSLAELAARHAEVLEELHLQVIAATLALDDARRERFRRLFRAAGDRPSDAQIDECATGYKHAYIAAWRPVPGALTLLERLASEARLGVISNNLQREQLQKMEGCGIDRFMDVVVISEAAGVAKPDPRIFELALAEAGCGASESVMVGDAWRTDIAGAMAAGVRPVWINLDAARPGDPAAGVAEFASLLPVEPLIEQILRPAPAGAAVR